MVKDEREDIIDHHDLKPESDMDTIQKSRSSLWEMRRACAGPQDPESKKKTWYHTVYILFIY